MIINALTSESPKAADRAAGFFADWLNELSEGALKAHLARLSASYRDLDSDELQLVVGWQDASSVYMCGAWRVDGRVEIVGPYVRRDYRRMSVGGGILRASFRLAWSEQDVYMHVPATMDWAPEILEREGLERVAPLLVDGIGDHWAFHSNMARRASQLLRRAREPSGGGSWVVLLHNDDITTYDFVVNSLMQIIDVNLDIAYEHANLVHSAGVAPIRFCRTERGAKRLVERIGSLAKADSFPLRATYERRK